MSRACHNTCPALPDICSQYTKWQETSVTSRSRKGLRYRRGSEGGGGIGEELWIEQPLLQMQTVSFCCVPNIKSAGSCDNLFGGGCFFEIDSEERQEWVSLISEGKIKTAIHVAGWREANRRNQVYNEGSVFHEPRTRY